MGDRLIMPRWVASTALLSFALISCTAENSSATASDPCQRRVDAAALAIDINETTEFVDIAIGICDTLSAFESAFREHPGTLGFSTLEVVARRCLFSSDARATNASMCGEAPVIALTGLPSFTEDSDTDIYIGVALDGRAIEMTPDTGVEFIRGIPADLIEVANLAEQNDCGGLSELAGLWRAETEFDNAERASVFAHATEVIADYIGCST